jgi:hypothetical protein
MTVLSVKAWFYRVTGIFLAYKEMYEFIDSERYWAEWQSAYSPNTSLRDIHGLIIGSWQAKHGFARPMSNFYRWKQSRRFKRLTKHHAQSKRKLDV